ITADEIKEYEEKVQVELRDVYDGMKEDSMSGLAEPNMPEVLAGNIDNYETAVPLEVLEKLNEDLLKRPEGFNVFKRLNRVFKRRKDILKEGNKAERSEENTDEPQQ